MSLAGTRLGPYDILAPLGAGGMGEVYRATDTRLKRQVALKILPAAVAGDLDRLARFQREAEVLASLNHPHIAAIYGLEDANGVNALVMELVEGPTLADRIAQGPLASDEALPIARQIAEALEAAHAQGIIHRDLKPANIKVRDDGTVKVLDFGLAKLTEQAATAAGRAGMAEASDAPTLTSPAMTAMGVILGTAAYMSPEQARGRVVDKRTDIWAFGAVLYEMLAGARAFTGEDLAETIASVMKSTPDWPPLAAHASPLIVNLVQRCLEKDRNARISDIAIVRFLLADHGSLGASFAAATAAAAATSPSGVSVPAAAGHAAGPAPAAAQARAATGSAPTSAAAATASAMFTAAAPASTAAARERPPMRAALAAVVLVLGVLVGALITSLLPRLLGRTTATTPVMHLQMGLAPADHLVGSQASVRPAATAFALSPDGRTAVFAGTRGPLTQLYVRSLDRPEATPMAGTDGATTPFLSPDGQWIGFLADNTIRKIAIAGGPAATICELPAKPLRGATWADDGTIYVSAGGDLFKVSAAGGTPALAATRDEATRHERRLLPQALPGGKALLFTSISSGWDSANVILQSLDTGQRRILLSGAADARVVGTGHLVYMKSGTLMAVPFDLRSQQPTGSPVALVEGVMQSVNTPNADDEMGAGQFVVSASGTLLYAVGGVSPSLDSTLMWVDRSGAAQPLPSAPTGAFVEMRLSPDGQRVAIDVRGKNTRNTDLWIYDTRRGSPTRLTVDGGGWAVWSPDGKRLIYGAGTRIYAINADGSGTPEPLTAAGTPQMPSSWSSGNVIAFLQRPRSDASGIWTMPLEGARTPRLFLESRFNLAYPELSPDGHWLAYVSTESGTREVYVQPYPGPGAKIRVSTSGGVEPIWTANGRELLYRSGTLEREQFLSVPIRSWSPFQVDTPRVLFETRPGEYSSTLPVRSWDVSPDGQRFLLQHPIASTDKPVSALHVVLNWTDELKRLASHPNQ